MSLLRDTVILAEVKMSANELMKPNSSTGEARVDILLRKLSAGEPIELNNGKMVVIDTKNKDVREFIKVLKSHNEQDIRQFVKPGARHGLIVVDDKGHGYSLADFKKADYFGGAGGSKSMTSTQTAWQESTQAMVTAVAIHLGRDVTSEDLTTQNFVRAKRGYDVDSEIEHSAEFIQDRLWNKSLVNVANIIRHHVKKGAVMHRGSGWVKGLEKKFNEVNKSQHGKVFHNKDKWNPSDIWAVEDGVQIPAEINDLVEFNAWLQKMFEEGKVVGFSLKKSPKNTKAKTFNYDGDLDDLLKLTVTDLLVSKSNKLFGSMSSFIMYESIASIRDILMEKSDSIEVRRFGKGDVNAEIRGKYAAGGKVGFGPVNYILRSMGLKELTHRNILARKFDDDDRHKQIVSEIVTMARKVKPDIDQDIHGKVDAIAKKLDFHQLASKYQAIELVERLTGLSEDKQRDFIQKLVQYASSRTELSSVFIKVW